METAAAPGKSLYERLGGEPGIRKLVNDVLDKNADNPSIGHHFSKVDMQKLKQLVFEFFSAGTGGPHVYTGRDMRTTHANLHITGKDFDEANTDTLQAMEENGVGQAEKEEVIAILNSLKHDVVMVRSS